MLEDYLKRLESLISPQGYNKGNFKEKLLSDLDKERERIKQQEAKIESSSIEARLQIDNLNLNMLNSENNFNNERTSSNSVNIEQMNHIKLELIDKNNLNSEENKKLIEEYLSKMGIKSLTELNNGLAPGGNIIQENRLKIYQKILENEGRLENPEQLYNSLGKNEIREIRREEKSKVHQSIHRSHNYSLSPSRAFRSQMPDEPEKLKEKVHQLNVKCMNYRHEAETLKTKINELNKTIEEHSHEISKSEKQKEVNNKYLLKLETLLAQQNPKNSLLFLKTNEKNNTFSIPKNEKIVLEFHGNTLFIDNKINNSVTNISDKNELKEYLLNLLNENQKLKTFQIQVFKISKNYDDINENMLECVRSIQQSLSKNIVNINNNILEIEDSDKKNIDGKLLNLFI